MNKKVLSILVAVLVVVVGGVLVLKKKGGVDVVKGVTQIMTPSLGLESPAKYLPENTLLFYSMSDIEGLWGGITSSKFWEELKKMRLWTDIGFQENLNKALAALKAQIGMEPTESRVMDLLGKRFTLAVLLGQNSEDVSVLLQTHVSKKTEFLAGAFQTLIEQGGQGIQKVEYEKETLYLVPSTTPEQPEVRFALVNDLLTVAVGKAEAEMKNVIDLVKGGGKSLSKNATYDASRKYLGDDQNYHVLSFMDFSRLSGVLTKVIEPLKNAQPEAFEKINLDDISKTLQQIKYVCARGVWGNSGLFNVKTFVVPDLDKMTEEQKTQWTAAEGSLQAIDFSPLEALVVNAAGNLNAGQMWKALTDAAAAAPAPAPANPDSPDAAAPAVNPMAEFMDGMKAWEDKSGVRVKEDLIDQIGEEVGFVFNGLSLEGQMPVPRLGVVIKAKDSKALYAKLSQAIEKTFSGAEALFPLSLEKKTVQGAEVLVLGTPFGEGLSPLIGNLDSWVFLASNQAFAEKLLSAKSGSAKKLGEKESFQKIIPDAQGKASQINFVDLAGLLNMVKELLNEVLKKNLFAALPNGAEISGTISTYAFPILDALRVFDSFGFSSRKQDAVMVQDVNLQLHDLK